VTNSCQYEPSYLQIRVVRVVLIEEIKGRWLDTGRAANPFWNREVLGRVGAHLLGEKVLEGLGPGDSIVELREVPQ
jgi:hypothetical protein